MKFAAMEGLNQGGNGVEFTVIGIPTNDPSLPFLMKKMEYAIHVPKSLASLLLGIMISTPIFPVFKIF